MMFLGVSIFVIYLPTWLERSVGLTGDQIALMFVVGGVANVLTGPNAGKLSDRIGRKGMILMSCVGLSILMVLTTRVVTGCGVPQLTAVLDAVRACETSDDCDPYAEIEDRRRYNKTYATMCYIAAEKISLCRWRGEDCPRPVYSDATRQSVCSANNVCTSAGWF